MHFCLFQQDKFTQNNFKITCTVSPHSQIRCSSLLSVVLFDPMLVWFCIVCIIQTIGQQVKNSLYFTVIVVYSFLYFFLIIILCFVVILLFFLPGFHTDAYSFHVQPFILQKLVLLPVYVVVGRLFYGEQLRIPHDQIAKCPT